MTKLRRYLRSIPTNLLPAALTLNLPVGKLINKDPNGYIPEIANRIASLLTFLAYPVAFVGIVYSVFQLIANSGNPDALKTTKKNIGYIAGGIFIMIFALVIFNFISSLFKPIAGSTTTP
jgi:hypothetical protein